MWGVESPLIAGHGIGRRRRFFGVRLLRDPDPIEVAADCGLVEAQETATTSFSSASIQDEEVAG
jgi:hypothetical protein